LSSVLLPNQRSKIAGPAPSHNLTSVSHLAHSTGMDKRPSKRARTSLPGQQTEHTTKRTECRVIISLLFCSTHHTFANVVHTAFGHIFSISHSLCRHLASVEFTKSKPSSILTVNSTLTRNAHRFGETHATKKHVGTQWVFSIITTWADGW